MNRFGKLAIALSFAVEGCQSHPLKVTTSEDSINFHTFNQTNFEAEQSILIDGESTWWLSEQFREVDLNSDNLELKVQEFRPWMPKFFVLINRNISAGEHIVNDSKEGWVDVSVKTLKHHMFTFEHKVGYFNIVNQTPGKVFSLINETPFSAPKCGLVSEAIYLELNMSIAFIDPYSCGDFTIVLESERRLRSMPAYQRERWAPHFKTLNQALSEFIEEARQSLGPLTMAESDS